MRQVVLDTETTGLEVGKGHRIIEIGCVELSERRATGRTLHRYFNPERMVDDGALAVHGISNDFLRDKPRFAELAIEIIEFIRGAELIIHNAAFDVAFLDMELALADAAHGCVRHHAQVLDTLLLAREKYPGQKNSLDALCKRLSIDNSHREFHGALLDAQLLAEVYIGLTSGQTDLGFGEAVAESSGDALPFEIDLGRPRPRVSVSDDELAAHESRLAVLRKKAGSAVWDRLTEPATDDDGAFAPA